MLLVGYLVPGSGDGAGAGADGPLWHMFTNLILFCYVE
jgi:hypothetical protein